MTNPGAYGDDREDYERNGERVAAWIFVRYTLKALMAALGLVFTLMLSPVALIALTLPAFAVAGTPRLVAGAAVLCVAGRALKTARLVYDRRDEIRNTEKTAPVTVGRGKQVLEILTSVCLNAPSVLGAELGLAQLGVHGWRWGVVAVLWCAPVLGLLLGSPTVQRLNALSAFANGAPDSPEGSF